MKANQIRKEVVFAYGLSLLLLVFFDGISRFIPLLRGNLLVVVAAIFLYVPSLTLAKNRSLDDFGLSFKKVKDKKAYLKKSLSWAFLLSAVTFVFFLPAYHLWATRVWDQTFEPDRSAYSRMTDRYYGAPAESEPNDVHIYQFNDVIHVSWQPKTAPWALQLETDGVIVELPLSEDRSFSSTKVLEGNVPQRVSFYFTVRRGNYIDISPSLQGDPLLPAQIAFGPGSETPLPQRRFLSGQAWQHENGARVILSKNWILISILVQLLLVALPEEFFYRGYLQRRLEEAKKSKRWHIKSLYLSSNMILVSAAFAFGHLVIGWNPARLAVFFPSLLFGFLRSKTDGLLAPIVYHALCNLLVQVISVHYLATN